MKRKIIIFVAAVCLMQVLAIPAVFAQKVSQELPQPTITINPDIYYPLDEILYIEGRAKPDETVQVNFQKAAEKPINLTTKSDGNGEWVLAEKVPLKAGDWEVRPRTILASGQTSAWSNPRVIKSIVNGIIIGGVTIKFAFLTFVIIVILAIGAGVIISLKKALREKERESATSFVEQNFIELRKKIEDELAHIEKRLEGGQLTDEEKEHREHLVRELREVQSAVEKKMKNIS